MRARKNSRRCFAEGGKVDPEQMAVNTVGEGGGIAAPPAATTTPPTLASLATPATPSAGAGIAAASQATPLNSGYQPGSALDPKAAGGAYQPGSALDPKTTFSTGPAPKPVKSSPFFAAPQNPVPQMQMGDTAPSSGLRALRGYAGGGKIKGPGTTTSDSIKGIVRETGEPIQVSTGERIVSAAQDALLEKMARQAGFDSLDALLESGTGKPVGPTIKGGKRAAEYGGKFDESEEIRIASGGDAVPNTAPTAPVTNDAPRTGIQAGITDPRDVAMGGPNYGDAAPSAPVTVAPGVQSPAVLGNATPEQSTAPQKSPLDIAKTQTVPSFIAALTANAPGPQSTPTGTVDVGSTAPGGTFKNGNKTYSVAATKQDGITKVTAPGKPPTFTNVGAMQAVGELNAVKPGTALVDGGKMDLNAANASQAKANAIRQSMIDGDGTGPKVTMLENSGLKETQALMDKWDMERLAKQNPQAAGIMRDFRANNDRAAADERHNQTTRRGQDVVAATQAAHLAGNPNDNALKRTQNQAAQMGIAKLEQQNALLTKLGNETDPNKRKALTDALLASQGRWANENRYMPVTTKEYNDMGQVIGERAAALDKHTGQVIGQPAQAPTQSGGKFVAGNTYTDAKGRKAIYQADGTWKEIG